MCSEPQAQLLLSPSQSKNFYTFHFKNSILDFQDLRVIKESRQLTFRVCIHEAN